MGVIGRLYIQLFVGYENGSIRTAAEWILHGYAQDLIIRAATDIAIDVIFESPTLSDCKSGLWDEVLSVMLTLGTIYYITIRSKVIVYSVEFRTLPCVVTFFDIMQTRRISFRIHFSLLDIHHYYFDLCVSFPSC